MKKEIIKLVIQYSDGGYLEIHKDDLNRIEALGEAMGWIQRAQRVYANLKPLFEKK